MDTGVVFPYISGVEIVLLFTRVPFFATLQSDRHSAALSFYGASPRHDTGTIAGKEADTVDRLDFVQSVLMAAAFFRRQLCR